MHRRHLLSILAICAIGILVAPSVRADVRLPSIFSDHMVIQQNEKIPIWGWADPGERVAVQLGDRKRSTKADDQGRWKDIYEANRGVISNPDRIFIGQELVIP